MQNKSRAFTLIELLVVVLIIGILSAVAVPQYQKAVLKSRYAALKNLTRSIADAQEIYHLANGVYASKISDLGIDTGGKPYESGKADEFPWGYCSSDVSFTQCQNSNIGFIYRIYYDGSRLCLATNGDENSIQNQFCKQETGATARLSYNESETAWKYR